MTSLKELSYISTSPFCFLHRRILLQMCVLDFRSQHHVLNSTLPLPPECYTLSCLLKALYNYLQSKHSQQVDLNVRITWLPFQILFF
uniref:Uncharacterized protein n=1 Tax=Populus trichocarpa TaxID=3694 RepID=A0A2K2AG07_POPTR